MKKVIPVGLAILFLFSCKKDTTTVVDIGKNYFPFKAGTFVEYDVDSTFYNDFFVPTKAINTKFRLKEKIQSLYYDNQNRYTARLERYVKYFDSIVPYDSIPWKLKNVWVQNITATTAEKVEENVRLVKLIFPVKENESWNINNQNFYEPKNVTYKSIDLADNIGGIAFESVLQTVFDDGGTILTSRLYFTEKYAKNVGLIYKNEINVESQPNSNSTTAELQLFYAKPILQRITSGYQYTWTVHSYGVE